MIVLKEKSNEGFLKYAIYENDEITGEQKRLYPKLLTTPGFNSIWELKSAYYRAITKNPLMLLDEEAKNFEEYFYRKFGLMIDKSVSLFIKASFKKGDFNKEHILYRYKNDILLNQHHFRFSNDDEDRYHDFFDKVYKLLFDEYEKKIVCNQIYEYAISIDVHYLLHFTPIENLENILKFGLVPRAVLDNNDEGYIFTDEYRFDGHTDCISLSITEPNGKMLYKKKNGTNKLVILAYSVALLRDNICAFYSHNAAGREMIEANIEQKETLESFKSMFGGIRSNLPSNITTDEQAEVLLQGVLDTKYLRKIYFNSNDEKDVMLYLRSNNLFDYINNELALNIEIQRCDEYFNSREYRNRNLI